MAITQDDVERAVRAVRAAGGRASTVSVTGRFGCLACGEAKSGREAAGGVNVTYDGGRQTEHVTVCRACFDRLTPRPVS